MKRALYLYRGALIVLLFAFVIIVGTGYLAIFEEPPIWYNNLPFTVKPDPVKRGETFRFNIDRCAKYTVDYSWTEHYEHSETKKQTWQQGSSATAQKGCQTVNSVPKRVPEDLEPGNYRLIFHIKVKGRF